MNGPHHGTPGAITGLADLAFLAKRLNTLGANDLHSDNYDAMLCSVSRCEDNTYSEFVRDILVSQLTNLPTASGLTRPKYGVSTSADEPAFANRINEGKNSIYGFRREKTNFAFDQMYRKKIHDIITANSNGPWSTIPLFSYLKSEGIPNERLVWSYLDCPSQTVGNVTVDGKRIPLIFNPWLLHLNVRFFANMPEAYKRRLFFYSGIQINEGWSSRNPVRDESLSLPLAAKMLMEIGYREADGSRRAKFGIVSDGAVPLTSQFLKPSGSFDSVGLYRAVGGVSYAVFGAKYNWMNSLAPLVLRQRTGESSDSSIPNEGVPFSKLRYFWDYHHDRVLNGAYRDQSSTLAWRGSQISGFESRSRWHNYMSASLAPTFSMSLAFNFRRTPEVRPVLDEEERVHFTEHLHYEPVFMSIVRDFGSFDDVPSDHDLVEDAVMRRLMLGYSDEPWNFKPKALATGREVEFAMSSVGIGVTFPNKDLPVTYEAVAEKLRAGLSLTSTGNATQFGVKSNFIVGEGNYRPTAPRGVAACANNWFYYSPPWDFRTPSDGDRYYFLRYRKPIWAVKGILDDGKHSENVNRASLAALILGVKLFKEQNGL